MFGCLIVYFEHMGVKKSFFSALSLIISVLSLDQMYIYIYMMYVCILYMCVYIWPFSKSLYIYIRVLYMYVYYIYVCVFMRLEGESGEREKSLKTLFHSSSYFQRLYNSLTRGLFAFVWSFSSDFLLKKNYWAIRKNSMQFK